MNTRTITTRSAVALLTTLCLTAGASAQSLTHVEAASLRDRAAVTVRVDDLNLTSPAGQKVLYQRLSNAAEKACGSTKVRRAGGPANAARNKDCQQASLSRALDRLNEGALAVLR